MRSYGWGVWSWRLQRTALVYWNVLFACLSCPVNCHVPAYRQAERLYRFYLVPLLPAVPYLNHSLLHHVFSLGAVKRYAQRKPVKFVFQRQHIVAETNFLHPLSILMTIDFGKSYSQSKNFLQKYKKNRLPNLTLPTFVRIYIKIGVKKIYEDKGRYAAFQRRR